MWTRPSASFWGICTLIVFATANPSRADYAIYNLEKSNVYTDDTFIYGEVKVNVIDQKNVELTFKAYSQPFTDQGVTVNEDKFGFVEIGFNSSINLNGLSVTATAESGTVTFEPKLKKGKFDSKNLSEFGTFGYVFSNNGSTGYDEVLVKISSLTNQSWTISSFFQNSGKSGAQEFAGHIKGFSDKDKTTFIGGSDQPSDDDFESQGEPIPTPAPSSLLMGMTGAILLSLGYFYRRRPSLAVAC